MQDLEKQRDEYHSEHSGRGGVPPGAWILPGVILGAAAWIALLGLIWRAL